MLAPAVTFVRDTSEAAVLAASQALCGATGPAFVTTATSPFAIMDVNDEWLATCGFSKREIVGETPAILQGPRTEADQLAKLMAGIGKGQRTEATLTNYAKNGDVLRNEVTITPLSLGAKGEGGAVTHFLAESVLTWLQPANVSFMDDTSEAAMLAVSEALRSAKGPAFVTTATHPFAIVCVNEDWLDTCGFSEHEVVGKTARMLQGARTEEAEVAKLMTGIREGMRTEVTMTNYTKFRDELRNEVTVTPLLLGAQGAITNFLAESVITPLGISYGDDVNMMRCKQEARSKKLRPDDEAKWRIDGDPINRGSWDLIGDEMRTKPKVYTKWRRPHHQNRDQQRPQEEMGRCSGTVITML